MRYVRDLTENERNELERMLQQEVGRVALRAHLILLSSRGYTVQQIEAIQQITNITVYKWLDRFEAEGPAGLYDEDRSGRPPKMDERAMQVLAEAVKQSPTALGYNFTTWTLPLLASHLKQQMGLDVSTETVRQALDELDYCWGRPRWAAPAAEEAPGDEPADDAEPLDEEIEAEAEANKSVFRLSSAMPHLSCMARSIRSPAINSTHVSTG